MGFGAGRDVRSMSRQTGRPADAPIPARRELAERVGFVPAIPAPINNLGPFSIAQIARIAQNLGIRYKTGTAKTAPIGYASTADALLSARSSKRSVMATPSLNRHDRSAAYSQRKATIGSARIARRAGTQHADSADAARSRITPANVSGSVGLVS